MFNAKRQSGWPVFGPGHKPLRAEVSGDTHINFFARRPVRQSSLTTPAHLTDSSMQEVRSRQSRKKG